MIDKLMKKYGYTKTSENEYGAYYKKREPQHYDHIVCVIHKASGRHIMQSYDSEAISIPGRSWGVCEGVGVEIPVLLLMWLKAKYLGVKYKWGRRRYVCGTLDGDPEAAGDAGVPNGTDHV